MTRKIKKVTVLTTDGVRQLNETAGTRYGHVARGIETLKKVKNTFTGNKPSAAPADDETEKPVGNIKSSAVMQIYNAVFNMVSGHKRVLMWLSPTELKDHYLVSKGPNRIVDAASDASIQAMFGKNKPTPDQIKLIFVKVHQGDNFTMKDMLDGFRVPNKDACVLLNVPNNIADKMMQFSDPKEIQNARAALAEIISHQYYIGTINLAAVRNTPAEDISGQPFEAEKFNVTKMVLAWGTRYLVDAAREEEQNANNKEVTDDDDELIQSTVTTAIKLFQFGAQRGKLESTGTERQTFVKSIKQTLGLSVDDRTGVSNSKLHDKEHLVPYIVRNFRNDERLNDIIDAYGDDAETILQEILPGRKSSLIANAEQDVQQGTTQAQSAAPQQSKAKLTDKDMEKLDSEAGTLQIGDEEITPAVLASLLRSKSPKFRRALEARLYDNIITKDNSTAANASKSKK